MTDELKNTPPQDLTAEASVLGAIILDPACIAEALDILRPEDFYRTAHEKIYGAMADLHAKQEPIDQITITDRLKASGALEKCGGSSYLSILLAGAPTSANVRQHARIVSDKKQLRDLSAAFHDGLGQVQSLQDPAKIISGVMEKLNAALRTDNSRIIGNSELARNGYGMIERRVDMGGALSGIPTGLHELDDMLDGLQPGELVLVGGRPAMGKTAFAETIRDNAARHFLAEGKGRAVGFVSIEMSERQLALRAISRASGVSVTRLRKGQIEDRHWERVARGAGVVSGLPIYHELSAYNDRQVERSIDTLVARNNCGVVIVDYLQLMRPEQEERTREQEVSKFSAMLKRKAKQYGIPVVALAQLNRSVEGRVDKRPILSDLRESGSLEQDADVLMFLYRDEVYKPCICEWNKDCACGQRGKAEVIVRKQRMGPIGTVECYFEKRTTTFREK